MLSATGPRCCNGVLGTSQSNFNGSWSKIAGDFIRIRFPELVAIATGRFIWWIFMVPIREMAFVVPLVTCNEKWMFTTLIVG